jgi:uncharacterized protein YdbL (DUF1318 family)
LFHIPAKNLADCFAGKQERKYMKNRKNQVIAGIILFMILLFLYQGRNLSKNSEPNNKNSSEVKENTEVKKNTADLDLTDNTTSTEAYGKKETPIVQTQSKLTKDLTTKINKVVRNYYKISNIKNTKKMSAMNQKEKVQSSEITAEKREVIESYQDIHTYIKPGLKADTYVVFTTYNIKLFNINTLVPGMSVLTVTSDNEETFQINDENISEQQKEYISQLSNDKEIKKIIQEVNSNLSKAIKKDASLKVFVDYMKKVS